MGISDIIVPLLLPARVLLAAVFGLAGFTKLLDRAGSRRALVEFGVPRRLVVPLTIALPMLEVGVAILLLPRATALYGALGALALLLTFIAAIGTSLARGRRPDCHCFGQLRSAPVGWQTLARNGALTAVAGFVVLAGRADAGPSVVAWLVPLTDLERFGVLTGSIAIALLAAQSVLLVRVVRQNDRLLRRLGESTSAPQTDAAATVRQDSSAEPAVPLKAGRPVGTVAPDFALESLDGDMVTLQGLRAAGKPILLLFSHPGCTSCRALLPEISQWQRDYREAFTLVVLSGGTPEANRAKLGEHGVAPVLLQRKREVAKAYEAVVTPSAVLVLADGTIGSPLALGDAQIRQLVAKLAPAVQQDEPPPAVLAPGFMLPDLDGNLVTLKQFSGKPTLVVFWSPACGFCRRMLGDLKTWEARPFEERTDLLVVSTGTVEDNWKLGLRSTTVLDPTSAIRKQYGLPGTPSAALIDGAGYILEKAVGAASILGLIGQPDSTRGKPAPTEITKDTTTVPVPLPPVTLASGARPLKHDCVQDELLPDGSMVLFNSCRRHVLTLNATGALVWECCDGEHDIDEITTEVRDLFPAAASADQDVRDVLDELLQASMIVPAVASQDPGATLSSPSA